MDILVIFGVVVAVATFYWFVIRYKPVPTVADITKPLHDIVNKLEGHAADQTAAADQHAANALNSTAAASRARSASAHAKHVADKVKQLVVPQS